MGRKSNRRRPLAGGSKKTSMSQKLKAVATKPWQCDLKFPHERLTALHENSRFSDLTITFPGHQDVMQGHKLIMAMSSPVFEAMFYGPMAQKDSLSLPDDPPEAFGWLLKYMYDGFQYFPSVKMVVQVYHLAIKYQMDALASFCSMRLQGQLTADNLPEIYDTCVLFEDTSLLHQCTHIMQIFSSDVLTSPYIGELSQNSFQHILQQKLNISSEVTVFNAVVLWGKAQLRKGTEDRDSLRQVTEELLIHVRFLTMTTDEMTEYVLPTGILIPEETSAILLNIKNVKNVKLPAEFSRNRKKRNVCFDRSFLRTITFKPNNESMEMAYQEEENSFAEDLTVSRIIYLKSIVDHGNILHDNSKVTIEDDTHDVVATGRVINRAVEFKKPVKLTKDNKYIISAKQENSKIRKIHCRYEYEPSIDEPSIDEPSIDEPSIDEPSIAEPSVDGSSDIEFDSDFECCEGENLYTYSGKSGNVVLKGNLIKISEGLTFHYFCLDN